MKHLVQQPLIVATTFVGLSAGLGKILIEALPPFPIISDSVRYLELAEQIIGGYYPAVDGVFYSPGYPVFLSLVFGFLDNAPTTVYQVQFLLLGVIAFLIYYTARRFFQLPYWLAGLAGLAVIFWPYLILYSLLIMTEVPYTAILLATILSTLQTIKNERRVWFVITGLLFGVAALMRPTALLLPLWLIITGVIFAHLGTYKLPPWRNIAIGLSCFALVITPWFYYKNTTEIPGASIENQSTYVFLKSFVDLSYDTDRDISKPATISEILVSKFKNVFYFWNPGGGGYQAEVLTQKSDLAIYAIWLYRVGFLVILLLAFLSILLPTHRSLILVWSVITYTWALHTVLFPYPRYTLPIIPLIILLATISLYNYQPIWNRLHNLFASPQSNMK